MEDMCAGHTRPVAVAAPEGPVETPKGAGDRAVLAARESTLQLPVLPYVMPVAAVEVPGAMALVARRPAAGGLDAGPTEPRILAEGVEEIGKDKWAVPVSSSCVT